MNGYALKELRENWGFSREELASRIYSEFTTEYDIESWEEYFSSKPPSYQQINDMANAFCMSASSLAEQLELFRNNSLFDDSDSVASSLLKLGALFTVAYVVNKVCDDSKEDGDETQGESYLNRQEPIKSKIIADERKAPFVQRAFGNILNILMIGGCIFLMDLAFDSFLIDRFGLTAFEFSVGIILIWGGYSFRKAAQKNDGGNFTTRLGGIIGNIALKTAGLLLIFVDLDIFSEFSTLLRISVAIALIIGGHFVQKNLKQ